jgi:hypothetical protein
MKVIVFGMLGIFILLMQKKYIGLADKAVSVTNVKQVKMA